MMKDTHPHAEMLDFVFTVADIARRVRSSTQANADSHT
jgi:hypothetical protein